MTHTFNVTEGTSHEMAVTLIKWQLTQPRTLLLYGLVFLSFIILAFEYESIAPLIIALIALAIGQVLAFNRVKRTVGRSIAKPNTQISIEIGDSTITIKNSQGESTMNYDMFENVYRQDRFVLLRAKSRVIVLVPQELFTEDEFAKVKAKITQTATPQVN